MSEIGRSFTEIVVYVKGVRNPPPPCDSGGFFRAVTDRVKAITLMHYIVLEVMTNLVP